MLIKQVLALTTVNNNKTHFVHINQGTSGTNYNNDGAKGTNSIAIGKASTAGDNSIIIGQGAISKSGDATKYGNGSGDIAIGMGVQVNNYVNQGGGIAIGQNARSENMNGRQEYYLGLGQTTYSGGGWISIGTPDNPENMVTGIAIGKNSYARSGGTMVGTHNYKGAIGDTTVDTANTINTSNNVLSTTVGANSFNAAALGSIVGTYSIASATDATQNFGATIMGSLNSVESATSDSSYAGVANSIVGLGNVANNTNGTLIFGAGNEVTNSITDISVPMSSSIKSAKDLQTRLKTAIKSSNSGGSTMVMGGGNKADYTQLSSVLGVNNTLTGTSDDISTYNYISGFNNTASNVDNVTVIGRNRTVTGADSSIVIGKADSALETTASDAVAIGRNTNVTGDGGVAIGLNSISSASNGMALGANSQTSIANGVALGANSIANVDKGVIGYDPSGKITDIATLKEEQSKLDPFWNSARIKAIQATIDAKQAEIDSAQGEIDSYQSEMNNMVSAWQSTGAAVSVGDSATGLSRQITNVAAGTNDTDAVNVAQLKAAKVVLEDGKNTTVTADNSEGYTKYTVDATDTKVEKLTFADNTLTLKQNIGDDLTVDGIASTSDLAKNKVILKEGNNVTITPDVAADGSTTYTINSAVDKIKYYSVNSDLTVNQDGKGAQGTNSIAIGPNAVAQRENGLAIGTNVNSGGKGSIVIGSDSKVLENIALEGSIVIGKNATAFTGGGEQEAKLGFDPTNWPNKGNGGYDNPTDPTRVATSIVIGTNAFGRTGSIDIGDRVYRGTMGGIEITDENNNSSFHVNQTTLGTNSYNKGLFSTMVGAYSIATGGFDGSGGFNTMSYGAQNFGATVVGSLNSIRSNDDSTMYNMFAGVANTIVGVGNITEDSNGSLVFGAGNKVSNSVGVIVAPTDGADSVDSMVDQLQSAVRATNSGGSTLVIGGGNIANYTQGSSIIGVNNTLTGSSLEDFSTYNALTGYNNTATNVDNVTVTGVNNTVSGSTSIVNLGNENAVSESNNTILLGDNRTVTGSDNSIILGRANKETTTTFRAAGDTTLTTTADNVVVMGYNANATVDDGVALGSNSVASVNKGVDGYNPSTKALTGSAWTSTLGSVSVGDVSNNMTRQITGVAAGTNDTDAVNVAQLKANKVDLKAGDKVTITSSVANDGATTYTIASTDTNTVLAKGEITYSTNGADGTLVLTDSDNNPVTVTGIKNTYVTSAALDTDTHTLTLMRNDGIPVEVTGIATTADITANKIHYFHVNSAANGTNYNNNGATGTDAIAIGTATAMPDNSVAIGNNARIFDSNGGKGSGDIAIGNGARINNYADQSASIALGQNAQIDNMAGQQEALFSLGQTTFSGDIFSSARIPADPSKVATGIAIGENTFVRSGGLMVGTHNYRGALGDVTVDSANTRGTGVNVNATTLGTNSYNNGAFSTITGAYSIASGNYAGGRNTLSASKNFGATIMGSLNSVESATASSNYSGIANSVVGTANRTFNSNGSLIFGAGNEITNSVTTINAPTSAGSSAKALQDTLMSSIKSSASGGSTLAIGGGNKADYTLRTAIIGVNNTVTGTSSDVSQQNYVTGYNNTATNVDDVTIVGTNRTVSNAANSVVIGSADSVMTSSASDAVTIGRNANTTVDGGVALGSSSVASVDKGALGYNPGIEELTDAEKASATWTSTLAAVSVGDSANNLTRQITNVAAGTNDTDAVNVAQLKANKVTLTAGDNVTITPTTATDGSTDYKIASTDTYVTAGSLSEDGTLTLTRNDKDPITVNGLATKADVAGSATHYYSVNDRGSTVANYDNTGAKAGMSIAAGPAASAYGSASTVTGAFSRIEGNGENGMSVGFQGATAAAYGSFNVVGAKDGVAFDGVANSVIGVANKTENANAALIMGAGNKITNSYRPVDLTTAGPLAAAMQKAIATGDNGDMVTALSSMVKDSGGAVLAIGGANTADYAMLSKVVGVGNTLTGTEGNESKLNMIDGFANTGTNISNVTVIGSRNTVADAYSTVVIGDNRNLTKASDSVILGSADSEMTTSVSNATAIGHNANVTVANGVALGSGSVASVDKGAAGYNPSSKELSGTAWTSTSAAVSVGDVANDITRQITGVAAGTNDTDAVNVAQLKANKVTVAAGANVTVDTATANDGSTTYTVNSTDTDTQVTGGSATYGTDGKGTITLNTDANGTKGTVTVTGLTDLYVDDVTFADNTLTIKRNDEKTWAIGNLATKDDVSGSATHYYSVNDRGNTVANYDNTGAKAGMSIAAGPAASAYGTASTVTGAFSRIEGNGDNGMSVGFQGATSDVYGSFNVVGAKDGVVFDGVANSVIGVANKTENANAALIMGAGNKITNSYRPVDLTTAGPLAAAMQKAIATGDNGDMVTALSSMVKDSGGAVLAIGGANTADYAMLSKVVGVGNTLTGTEGNESKLNMIDGFANTGTNISNVTVIGSRNTVEDAYSTVVIGDNRNLTKASDSVILGSADQAMTTSVSNATAIGHNANVTVANGVALGSGSVASVDAGVAGYDVETEKASTNTTATWKSTLAAVSVGVPTDGGAATATRQITGVAAGMQDTDAVNVAQLKKVAEAANEAGNTTLKFTGDDTTAEISRTNNQVLNIIGGATATDADGNSLLTDNNIGVVKDGDNALKVKLAKDLTGLNSVAVGDAVKLGTTGLTITNGPSVTTAGIDAGSKVITNVANGVNPTDAVNVSQLTANKVTVAEGTNVTVTPTTANDGSTTYTVAAKDTYTTAGTYDKDGKKITFTQNDTDKNYEVDVSGLVDGISEDIDKGLNFAGDSGDAINKKLDQTLDIVGGAKGDLTTGNIGVVSEDGKLNVRLAKDLTGLNSVAVGDAVKLGTTGLTITNGPSVTTAGIDAGSKVITNVANGVNPTDAVNVSQLTANKVTVAEGTNVTVTPTTANDGSTTYTVAAKDTYTTAGTYDKDGKKITFTQNDTDKNYEVDVSGLVDGISEDIDKGLNFAGDSGDAINKKLDQTLDIVGGAKGDLTTGNIGVVPEDGKLNVRLAKDLTGLNSVAVGDAVKLGTTGLTIVNGPSVTTTGINAGSKVITNVANGVNPTDAVNVSQLTANKVTVAEGTNVTVTPTTANDGSTTYTVAAKDTYTTAGTYDKDGKKITFTQNDTDKNYEVDVSGLVDGISEDIDKGLNFAGDSGDAINKKLDQTLDIVGGAKGDLTTGNIGVISEDGKLNVRLAKDVQDLNSVRIGGTTTDGKGIYIANQTVTYTKDGAAGESEKGNYITGLTNKSWDPTNKGYVSGRAATEDQLKSVYDTIDQNIKANKVTSGKNITVDKDNKVNLNDEITLGDAASNNVAISGTNGTITAGDGGSNQVAIDGTKSTITAGTGDNKVTVDGNNGLVTVGDTTKGAISIGNQTVTPKVVGADGTETDGTAKSGQYITGLDNTTWNPTGEGYVADRAATEGQLKDIADQISNIDTAVKSSSRVFESDSTEQVTRKNTDPMKLKGGATGELSDGNIGVVNNSDKTGFDIKLAKDIKGLNSIEVNNKITIGTGDNQTIIEGDTINTGSVTTGNTTVNNDGLTIVNEDSSKNITINNNNVNMGGNVIKNIGEGSEPTDAINKGQFDRAINNLGTGMNQINNRVNKLDNRVNRVGAGAAALAALHPLEFSPDAKWEVTAGVGNYRGANAIALGAFYRPNFDTMFSIGTSYGGGENMINAGVTWRIGEGETKAYPSKTVMAQEIDDLKTVVSEQQDQIEELKKLVNSLINK